VDKRAKPSPSQDDWLSCEATQSKTQTKMSAEVSDDRRAFLLLVISVTKLKHVLVIYL